MTDCILCGKPFDPQVLPDDPAVHAGRILARERYQDDGRICAACLASRGRLAMMYDQSCHE
jgi:hypothetical protein